MQTTTKSRLNITSAAYRHHQQTPTKVCRQKKPDWTMIFQQCQNIHIVHTTPTVCRQQQNSDWTMVTPILHRKQHNKILETQSNPAWMIITPTVYRQYQHCADSNKNPHWTMTGLAKCRKQIWHDSFYSNGMQTIMKKHNIKSFANPINYHS